MIVNFAKVVVGTCLRPPLTVVAPQEAATATQEGSEGSEDFTIRAWMTGWTWSPDGQYCTHGYSRGRA